MCLSRTPRIAAGLTMAVFVVKNYSKIPNDLPNDF